MKEPSKAQVKERTKHLRSILMEKHKIDLPQGHALEIMAKVFGFNDWNTASALLPEREIGRPVESKNAGIVKNELPFAAKFKTAGELADFFAQFSRETKVVVQEYEERELNLFETLTSICAITYDQEIQNGNELKLELVTEDERELNLKDFGKNSTQSFDRTNAGRSQRRVKFLNMMNSFWNQKPIA